MRQSYLCLRRKISKSSHKETVMSKLFSINVRADECDTDLTELVLEEIQEPCPRKRQRMMQINELNRKLVDVQTNLENKTQEKHRMRTRIEEV